MATTTLADVSAALKLLRTRGLDADVLRRIEHEAASHRRRYRHEYGVVLDARVDVEETWALAPRSGGDEPSVTSAVKTSAKPGTGYVGGMPAEWLPPRLVLHVLR